MTNPGTTLQELLAQVERAEKHGRALIAARRGNAQEHEFDPQCVEAIAAYWKARDAAEAHPDWPNR
jgi:hypothetical protein